MDLTQYRDIAPYDPDEVKAAIERLRKNDKFLDSLGEIFFAGNVITTAWKARQLKEQIVPLLDDIETYSDFQKNVTAGLFIPTIIKNSVAEFTYSGLDRLDKQKPYLFISNHRDIVLDCALLDYALMQEDMQFCEMAIGDNLLVSQFATDLFKLNGGITVKRELPMREKYLESLRLSQYFVELITEKKKSIWVAQKSGRAKDGKDITSPSIIKMLYLSQKGKGKSFSQVIRSCNIVPVAVSYEYDPCDINKGREEVSKRLRGTYQKKKYEDVINMLRGLRRYKGNVHISFGVPLDGEYANPEEVASEIDRQIHLEYRQWDSNYFAYDYLSGSDTFASEYSDLNTKKFLSRYTDLAPEVRSYVLNSYANPVASRLEAMERDSL